MRWRGQEDECGKEAVIVKCYNQRDVYAQINDTFIGPVVHRLFMIFLFTGNVRWC